MDGLGQVRTHGQLEVALAVNGSGLTSSPFVPVFHLVPKRQLSPLALAKYQRLPYSHHHRPAVGTKRMPGRK
jgi:hypothetical protein